MQRSYILLNTNNNSLRRVMIMVRLLKENLCLNGSYSHTRGGYLLGRHEWQLSHWKKKVYIYIYRSMTSLNFWTRDGVHLLCASLLWSKKKSQILFQKLRLSHDLESQKLSILGNCWQGPKILWLLSFCLIDFAVSPLMFLVIQAQYLNESTAEWHIVSSVASSCWWGC